MGAGADRRAACAVVLAACSTSAAAHPAASAPGSSAAPSPQASAPIAEPPGPPPTTLAGYYAQKLHWQACDQGFQCARLLVPFDYRRPAWRRFSLPVIRLAATDPARRIGSLVVNPGGPGGSGISYALQARSEIAAPVRARFDIVGFDPRGVGASEPAISCLTGPQLDTYFSTNENLTGASHLAPVVAEAKQFARGCERESGALLPWVGTRNAARDMDVLRAALGDAKLTYLGKSYGTYLGTWYAQLFPSHVRALVLDGAIDPGSSSLRMNIVQGQGFEVALRAFVADCVARAGCPVGRGSVAAGVARIQALVSRATAHPLVNNLSSQRADGALVLNGIATALYSQAYWPTLREALTVRVRRRRDRAGRAGQRALGAQRQRPVHQPGRREHGGGLPGPALASGAVGLARWRAAAATAARAAPAFGASIMWGSLPCAYWPVRSYPAAVDPRRGRPADPGHRQQAGPGHAVPLGPGPGRGPEVRGAAGVGWQRAHRVHDGQLVRGRLGEPVPAGPGCPAQRHRLSLRTQALLRARYGLGSRPVDSVGRQIAACRLSSVG